MQPVLKAIILALFLTGCGTTGVGISQTTPVPDLIIPRPTAPVLHEPQFMVVNRDNFDQLRALVDSGQIIIAMTRIEFETMLTNNQQIMVFIANQNTVLDQYDSRITSQSHNRLQ